jgi:maltose/moltooligosaccharide transporter
VQPIVGYYSDRTWNRLGRRRPYFLGGAVLTTLALFAMPNSSSLWIAAGLLWLLDASLNISMEAVPRVRRRSACRRGSARPGYAMQSFFIGIGAVVASLLPWLLAAAGVENSAEPWRDSRHSEIRVLRRRHRAVSRGGVDRSSARASIRQHN